MGAFAVQVSRFNDRIHLGLIDQSGQFLVPVTDPVLLPESVNVPIKQNVGIIYPPAAHYVEELISVSGVERQVPISEVDDSSIADVMRSIKELSALDVRPDSQYPTYRLFHEERLRLDPREQIDFELKIIISRPLLSEIKDAEDLQVEAFLVVLYEEHLGEQGHIFVRIPLFLW